MTAMIVAPRIRLLSLVSLHQIDQFAQPRHTFAVAICSTTTKDPDSIGALSI